MRLTFLGTRANLETSTPRHQRHSALLIEQQQERLLIDCGRDWGTELTRIAPTRILLTHAHDDHSGGLCRPFGVPVWATAETWRTLPELARDERARTCQLHTKLQLGNLSAIPLPLPHSRRAPAVGWLISHAGTSLFYAPDIAAPPEQPLPAPVALYIGDGSSFGTALQRQEGGDVCGHAPIAVQMEWCRDQGIGDIIFTHCGEEILADCNGADERLSRLAAAFAVSARFAMDGLEVSLGGGRPKTPAGND